MRISCIRWMLGADHLCKSFVAPRMARQLYEKNQLLEQECAALACRQEEAAPASEITWIHLDSIYSI